MNSADSANTTNADGAHHQRPSIGATCGAAVARLGGSMLADFGSFRLRTVSSLSTRRRAGALMRFERFDFVEASSVPFGPREPCLDKRRDQLGGERWTDDARAQRQHVHRVVFHTLVG